MFLHMLLRKKVFSFEEKKDEEEIILGKFGLCGDVKCYGMVLVFLST